MANINIQENRRMLAEEEYTHVYLKTGNPVDAKNAYRKVIGDLKAKPPDSVELQAIDLRRQTIKIIDTEIRRLKRNEWKEFNLLHAHVRKMLLQDDIAEFDIPDTIKNSDMKVMTPKELDIALDSMKKLQEIRRGILNV